MNLGKMLVLDSEAHAMKAKSVLEPAIAEFIGLDIGAYELPC